MGIVGSKTKRTNEKIIGAKPQNETLRKRDICDKHVQVAICSGMVRGTNAEDWNHSQIQNSDPDEHIQIKRQPKTKITNEEWIRRFIKFHGPDRYVYEFSNNSTEVIAHCNLHNETYTVLKSNLTRHGLQCCRNYGHRQLFQKKLNKFVEDAIQVHGSKYDYSLVEYMNTHTKVNIVCKYHGTFTQSPLNHLQGAGCRRCYYDSKEPSVGGYTMRRFNTDPSIRDVPSSLYLIEAKSSTEQFIKIGVTEKDIDFRFRFPSIMPYEYKVLAQLQGKLYDMFLTEQEIKRRFKQFRYKPTQKFNGYTECFSVDVTEEILKIIK